MIATVTSLPSFCTRREYRWSPYAFPAARSATPSVEALCDICVVRNTTEVAKEPPPSKLEHPCLVLNSVAERPSAEGPAQSPAGGVVRRQGARFGPRETKSASRFLAADTAHALGQNRQAPCGERVSVPGSRGTHPCRHMRTLYTLDLLLRQPLGRGPDTADRALACDIRRANSLGLAAARGAAISSFSFSH